MCNVTRWHSCKQPCYQTDETLLEPLAGHQAPQTCRHTRHEQASDAHRWRCDPLQEDANQAHDLLSCDTPAPSAAHLAAETRKAMFSPLRYKHSHASPALTRDSAWTTLGQGCGTTSWLTSRHLHQWLPHPTHGYPPPPHSTAAAAACRAHSRCPCHAAAPPLPVGM